MDARLPRPADLAAPDVSRLIMRLALPAIAGLSINALHHATDMVFLGMLGTEAVSAVGATFPLVILMAAVSEGISVGTASHVSRLLGAGRGQAAETSAGAGLALILAAGLALTPLLAVHLEALLAGFGVTRTALPLARGYMHIVVAGYTLMMLHMFCDFLAIAEGNTRFSMWTLVGSFTLNIALDPIFIFALDLGVAGAAMATVVAHLAALTAYGVYFGRALGSVRPRPRAPAAMAGSLGEILMVGAPAAGATAVTALALALVYRTAGAYGDSAVAGIAIALRLFNLGALPVFGFCLGGRPVLGFAWGAGDHRRVLRAMGFMLGLTTAFCLALTAVMLSWSAALVSLFTAEGAVRDVGMRTTMACFVLFPLFGMHAVLLTFLQAAGKARLAALLLLAPQGYFLIPGLLILPELWGLAGLIASPAVAAGLTAALAAGLLLQQIADLRTLAGADD